MKTKYKALYLQPKPHSKKNYFIVHPLTFRCGKLLRKAICTWSWGDVYARLDITTEGIPYKQIPIVIRKEKA